MFRKLRAFICSFKINDITIDITSRNTIILQQGTEGATIRVNEPSILVIDGDSCIAFGRDAESIVGRCPEGVKTIYPVLQGAIAEPHYCEQLLKHYIKTVAKNKGLYCIYPNVLAVHPQSSTSSHQKILAEAIDAAGAKGIDLVSTLQAAARGIGMGKENSGASIILNMAKDYTEIGILSMNKVHFSATYPFGYDDFQKAIVNHIRGASDLSIGLNNAKRALDHLGVAHYIPDEDEGYEMIISGLLKRTSVPTDLRLTRLQVYTAIRPLVDSVVEGLLEVLEKAREDMAEDLKLNGVTIVGVGGNIARLDSAISDILNIKAIIAPNYETCIIEGAGKIQTWRKRKKWFSQPKSK